MGTLREVSDRNAAFMSCQRRFTAPARTALPFTRQPFHQRNSYGFRLHFSSLCDTMQFIDQATAPRFHTVCAVNAQTWLNRNKIPHSELRGILVSAIQTPERLQALLFHSAWLVACGNKCTFLAELLQNSVRFLWYTSSAIPSRPLPDTAIPFRTPSCDSRSAAFCLLQTSAADRSRPDPSEHR